MQEVCLEGLVVTGWKAVLRQGHQTQQAQTAQVGSLKRIVEFPHFLPTLFAMACQRLRHCNWSSDNWWTLWNWPSKYACDTRQYTTPTHPQTHIYILFNYIYSHTHIQKHTYIHIHIPPLHTHTQKQQPNTHTHTHTHTHTRPHRELKKTNTCSQYWPACTKNLQCMWRTLWSQTPPASLWLQIKTFNESSFWYLKKCDENRSKICFVFCLTHSCGSTWGENVGCLNTFAKMLSESTFTYKNVKLSSVPVTVCAGNPPISKQHHHFWKGLDTVQVSHLWVKT